MSNQHRATTKQWAYSERWAAPPDSDAYATCLLELRARVEALEAASSHRQHGKAADSDAAPSLVARVVNAMYNVARDSDTAEARAAIREVAAWLRSEYPQREGYGTAWANLIEEEASR